METVTLMEHGISDIDVNFQKKKRVKSVKKISSMVASYTKSSKKII